MYCVFLISVDVLLLIQYHTVLIHTVRWWAHVMRESVVASSVLPGDVGGAPDSLDDDG